MQPLLLPGVRDGARESHAVRALRGAPGRRAPPICFSRRTLVRRVGGRTADRVAGLLLPRNGPGAHALPVSRRSTLMRARGAIEILEESVNLLREAPAA